MWCPTRGLHSETRRYVTQRQVRWWCAHRVFNKKPKKITPFISLISLLFFFQSRFFVTSFFWGLIEEQVKNLLTIEIFLSTLGRHLDYGRPISLFFIEIQTFWAWADNILGHFFFCQLSASFFGTVSPLSIFFIIRSLFLQKTKLLYSHPRYSFGIGIWIWLWTAKN